MKPPITLHDGITEPDLEPLEKILRGSGFFRENEILVAIEVLLDGIKKADHSDYMFIRAMQGEKIVGYCSYGKIPESTHSYDVYWIAVDPGQQRSGIGKKLLVATEERIIAMGGKRIYVETSSQPLYEPTRQFYLRCAYKIEATLEEFYAPGDGKVIFVKAV
jgi:ribosomal protein S18 acetylase RimI-like enzyme